MAGEAGRRACGHTPRSLGASRPHMIDREVFGKAIWVHYPCLEIGRSINIFFISLHLQELKRPDMTIPGSYLHRFQCLLMKLSGPRPG